MVRRSVPTVTSAPASAGVVDVITGAQPVVPPLPGGPLSEVDARVLTGRIRATAREIGDRLARLRVLVDQARDGEAWVALGYASWTAYLADTLEPMRLPRAERREVVGYLTGEGMSTRAIAPIVSADPKTVVNDRRAIAAAGVEDSTPADAVTGRDGRRYSTVPTSPPRLVVVPPAPDQRPAPAQQPSTPRDLAASALRDARERASLDPMVGPWHAAAAFRRAGDVAARSAARHLAAGRDGDAHGHADAFVLLEDRARRALTRTSELRQPVSAIATTKVG